MARASSEAYCPKTAAPVAKGCPLFVPEGAAKPTAYGPVEPLPILGRTILAHEYSVCGACFTEQYERKYGIKPEGVD